MPVFTWENLWPGAILLALFLLLLLRKPLSLLFHFLLRSAVSLGFLFAWSASGLLPGLALGANCFNAITLGVLCLPGFALLLLLRWLTFT